MARNVTEEIIWATWYEGNKCCSHNLFVTVSYLC